MLCELALIVELLEDFRRSPADSDLVGLGGTAGGAVEAMLADAISRGSKIISRVSRDAVTRLMQGFPSLLRYPQRLFSDNELSELTEMFEKVNATSDLLGRALVRDWARRMEEKNAVEESLQVYRGVHLMEAVTAPLSPLTPEAALNYFLGLVPKLGVDPLHFGLDMRRRAFTLAVATDKSLLSTVQDIIGNMIRTGDVPSGTPRAIQGVLDTAGVASKNPQYSEMVLRTNAMDSYNVGAWEEMTHPDVVETFPVWQYSNPVDERSRPTHAAKDGLYYPVSMPFNIVRGTGIGDKANCRCTPIPIDRWTWAELESRGVRLAA